MVQGPRRHPALLRRGVRLPPRPAHPAGQAGRGHPRRETGTARSSGSGRRSWRPTAPGPTGWCTCCRPWTTRPAETRGELHTLMFGTPGYRRDMFARPDFLRYRVVLNYTYLHLTQARPDPARPLPHLPPARERGRGGLRRLRPGVDAPLRPRLAGPPGGPHDGALDGFVARAAAEVRADQLGHAFRVVADGGVLFEARPRPSSGTPGCRNRTATRVRRRRPAAEDGVRRPGPRGPRRCGSGWPSHWTASIRHDRTASPSTSTVHAPADALFAAQVGAGEPAVVPQHVGQDAAGFDLQRVGVAVHGQGDPHLDRGLSQGSGDQDGDDVAAVLHVGVRFGHRRGVVVGGDAAGAGERVVGGDAVDRRGRRSGRRSATVRRRAP